MYVQKDWLGYWELPKPDKGKEREWHIIARVSRTIPFGYEVDKENEKVLQPIVVEGLRKRITIEQKRKRTASIKRNLARRLQETLSEIKKLEEEGIGSYSRREETA